MASEHCYTKHVLKLSDYVQKLDSVSKGRYLEKLCIQRSNGGYFYLPDPYNIDKSEWKDDASLWPKMDSSHVQEYLTKGPGKNYKSLSAYEYVVSGKVQRVDAYVPNEMPHLVMLTAFVQPSQKTRDDVYHSWVLCKESGHVISAHCTCMAGLGEACSHVAALLYKVQLGVSIGISSSATDKGCQWNNSFTNKVKAVPLKKINFKKTKWDKHEKENEEAGSSTSHIKPISTQQIDKLKEIMPNAVFFTTGTNSSSEDSTDTASEGEGENFEISSLSVIIKKQKITSSEDLQKIYDLRTIEKIEKQTRGQTNKLWYEQRSGRVTSSNFGAIFNRKSITSKFISQFIDTGHNLSTPAIRWGKNNEKKAFSKYYHEAKKTHINFHLQQSGLFICETDPYLGSSPDGLIHCQCCGRGVLEIKCPYKFRNEDPKRIHVLDKNFCLDEGGCLKENHHYYAQVQGQMAITKSSYCDFVIWTTNDITITRVYEDKQYWLYKKPLLKSFFFNHILPAIEAKV